MPSTEGKHELANSWRDLKLVFIHLNLAKKQNKTDIIAALQMKEETGSMDVCPA